MHDARGFLDILRYPCHLGLKETWKGNREGRYTGPFFHS